MEIKILTDEQLPEAIGLARGVFDYCLRNTIPNPKMVQAFEQYIHQDYLKHMINEGYLVMWGAYEQNTIAGDADRRPYYNAVYPSDVSAPRNW